MCCYLFRISLTGSALLSRSSPTTYVMEEDEPSFLEPIDYSEDSNDEEAEPENDPSNDGHENPDHHDSLSDPETSRDWGGALQPPPPQQPSGSGFHGCITICRFHGALSPRYKPHLPFTSDRIVMNVVASHHHTVIPDLRHRTASESHP